MGRLRREAERLPGRGWLPEAGLRDPREHLVTGTARGDRPFSVAGEARRQPPSIGRRRGNRLIGQIVRNITLKGPSPVHNGGWDEAQTTETVAVNHRPVAIRGQVDRPDPFASSQRHSTAAAG
jgi:hypothetical protein